MFQPVSVYIGLRYSRSNHGKGFVSFITFFSIIGIVLDSWWLILGLFILQAVLKFMGVEEGEILD